MRHVSYALNQEMSRYFAEHTTLPALLPLVGVSGRLRALESARRRAPNDARLILDTLGGADFWVETRLTLVTVASRVQRHYDEAHRSLTWRTQTGDGQRINWHPTEVHKRVEAYETNSFMPDWTCHGYVTADGKLHHGAIIRTWELTKAYLDARAECRRRGIRMAERTNPQDGSKFWPAYWDTLRRHGNATTLHVIEPPSRPSKVKREDRPIDMECPDCWHPARHRSSWAAHPRTGRLVCKICHPTPGLHT